MIHLHNTAPAGCRTCGHFERREIHGGATVDHDDGNRTAAAIYGAVKLWGWA